MKRRCSLAEYRRRHVWESLMWLEKGERYITWCKISLYKETCVLNKTMQRSLWRNLTTTFWSETPLNHPAHQSCSWRLNTISPAIDSSHYSLHFPKPCPWAATTAGLSKVLFSSTPHFLWSYGRSHSPKKSKWYGVWCQCNPSQVCSAINLSIELIPLFLLFFFLTV